MPNLLLIPLEDSVVFPNMSVTLTIDVGDDERVFLVPVHEGEYAGVGTVAEVSDLVRLPGGGRAVTLVHNEYLDAIVGHHSPNRV